MLSIHYRRLRELRRQRTSIDHGNPIRRFWRHGSCRSALVPEPWRSLHVDYPGLHKCASGTCAVHLLQVWTVD